MDDTGNPVETDGTDGATNDVAERFPSLASLRAAHAELLKRHRESGDTPELLAEIEDFIRRGQATGALLDAEDDRWAGQSLLDYWATLLYRIGREPPDATLAEFDPSLAPELDDALCPYVGLDAFREINHDVFFGRQRLVEDMISRLEENRLLAVVGPSGSGKSSLVLAGLLPALKAGAMPGSQNWRYYPRMVPGSNPLKNLARLLRPADVDPSEWTRRQVARFQQDPGHLAQLIADLGEGPAVLVIDQFEEVFTLCEDDEVRQAFVDNLLGLVRSPDDRHIVILTMRVDFEPRLARLPALQSLFGKARVSVPPLSAAELRRAIEEPAALVGLKFEEGVVDALLQDILGEPAALPLLQFTLLKLWENRERNRVTWEAYSRLGGGRQALARSADEFYEGLIPEEQVTARRILLRMVRPGEGLEVTSNRVRRDELYQAGEARDRIDRVLNRLIRARLVHLTEGDAPGDAQVEVAHEALVRNWPRLVDWVEDEREIMRRRLRLTAAAEHWEALGRDPEALWRGALLEEAQRYRGLNELEAEFVAASRAAVEQARREEEAARRRELAQARALAEERANAARRLGWLAVALTVALLLAVWGGVSAARQRHEAQSNADLAATREAEAHTAQAAAEDEAHARATEVVIRSTAEAEAERIAAEYQSLDLAEGAQYALDNGDTDTALALALRANNIVERPSAQAKQVLTKAAYASATRRRFDHDAPVYSAAFSPDGRTVLSGLGDGTLILWDIESGTEIRRFAGHAVRVWSVAISPDGRTALSASADATLILWDIKSGREIQRFIGHTDDVLGVAFSPDGRTALSGSKDHTVILWDVKSGEIIRRLKGHTDWVWSVDFGPDGRTALSCSEDDSLILWDVEGGKEIRRLERHTDGVRTVAFGPDGRTALSGSYDGTLIRWDIEGGTARVFAGYADMVYSVAFSPDGRSALLGTDVGSLLLWDVESGEVTRRFEGHTDWVRTVAFSPDGRTALSGSEDGSLRLWDIESGAEVRRFGGGVLRRFDIRHFTGHSAEVFGAAIGPDGRTALSSSFDGSLILWDVASGEEIRRFEGHAAEVFGVAIGPDGRTALSASADGSLILWDLASGAEVRRFEGHTAEVFGVAISPDGRTALSSSLDGSLILWDLASGAEIRRFVGRAGAMFGVAIGPDGRTALSGSVGGSLILWDLASGAEIRRFEGHSGAVYDVDFSADGLVALSGSGDNDLILWDVASGAELRRFEGHTAEVFGVAISPDGRTALSSSLDGSLILWDMASGTEIHRLTGHADAVFGVAISPDGRTALSASADGSLILWDIAGLESGTAIYRAVYSVAISPDGRAALSASADGGLILWDIESGEEVRRLVGHTDAVNGVAFGPDGRTALSGSEDAALILWDIESGAEIRRFEGHDAAVLDVAIAPDGNTAMSSSEDASLVLWDVASGTEIHRFAGHTDWVFCVAISPDGRTALSGSADGTLILWDIESVTETRRFEGHTGWVLDAAFSPDGRTALSGSSEGELILWDVASGEEVRRFEGHPGSVRTVAFGPDGHIALSGSSEGELILWDVESGVEIYRFRGHTDAVNDVIFSPDGYTALSGSEDGSLILWRTYSPDELRAWTPANRYVRELTCDEREQYRIRPFCPLTASPTPTPELTPTPTATPVRARAATRGDNRGELPVGGAQVWTYSGQAGEVLTIKVNADRPANTASDRERRERELLDTLLIVYAPDGTVMAEADDIERGIVTDSSTEVLVLPTDGVYRIEVRSRANLTGGPYTLTIIPAEEIAFGETVTGTVELGGRYVWMFEGAAGQVVTITMSGDDGTLDAYLTLLSPDGAVLVTDDDGGGGTNSMIGRFLLPETGVYMIVASGYRGYSVGAYTLTLIGETETGVQKPRLNLHRLRLSSVRGMASADVTPPCCRRRRRAAA